LCGNFILPRGEKSLWIFYSSVQLDFTINHNIKVEIMTTISRQNYRRVESICEEAYKLGASKLYLTNYIKEGAAQNNNSLVLSPDEIKEFVDNLTFIRTKYPKDQLYIYRSGLFDSMYYLTKDTFRCYLPT